MARLSGPRARRGAILVVGALALVRCAPLPPLRAPPLEVAAPIEITDDTHLTYAGMWTNTNVVRVGDTLYFSLQTSQADTNSERGATYVRALTVGARTPGPFVEAWSLRQPGVSNHQHPSLARDGRGRVLVIADWIDPAARRTVSHLGCAERPGDAAREQSCGIGLARWFRTLHDPSTWSPDATGLRMRVRNTFNHAVLNDATSFWAAGLRALDFASAYDEGAGIGYLIGEAYNQHDPHTPIDGRVAAPGLARLFYRLVGDTRDPANIDGPYLLVEGAAGYPAPSPRGGNVMAKGMLRLGPARGAFGGRCRTLWIAWSARNQWIDAKTFLFFDTSLARSDDCGLTFVNLAGTTKRSLLQGIAWNDPAFRVIRADHGDGGQGGLAIDPDGTPWIAKRVWDGAPRGPTVVDPREGNRVHFADSAGPHTFPLVLHRCRSGAKECERVAEIADASGGRASLHFSRDGAMWLFEEQPATYSASRDGGRSFDPRVRFGPDGYTWRLHVSPDSVDPDLAHVVIEQRGGAAPYLDRSRLYYVAFRAGSL